MLFWVHETRSVLMGFFSRVSDAWVLVAMGKSVAKLFVPVALLTAVSPAAASLSQLKPSPSAESYTAYYDGHYGPFHNGYWTGSNEYYFSTAEGRLYVRDDGHHFRKVLVTGYHPVEGFGPALPKSAESSLRE